jgi:hypothetical protein
MFGISGSRSLLAAVFVWRRDAAGVAHIRPVADICAVARPLEIVYPK